MLQLIENGGQGRNRTADASLFRAALYHLSYLATRPRRRIVALFAGVTDNVKARASQHRLGCADHNDYSNLLRPLQDRRSGVAVAHLAPAARAVENEPCKAAEEELTLC